MFLGSSPFSGFVCDHFVGCTKCTFTESLSAHCATIHRIRIKNSRVSWRYSTSNNNNNDDDTSDCKVYRKPNNNNKYSNNNNNERQQNVNTMKKKSEWNESLMEFFYTPTGDEWKSAELWQTRKANDDDDIALPGSLIEVLLRALWFDLTWLLTERRDAANGLAAVDRPTDRLWIVLWC